MTEHLLAVWGMAGFLSVMAGMNAWNIRLLWRDKRVVGISPLTVLFRSSANVWQAWFFFQMGEWAAFSAAVPATALNLAWVVLALYYQRWPAGRHDLRDSVCQGRNVSGCSSLTALPIPRIA